MSNALSAAVRDADDRRKAATRNADIDVLASLIDDEVIYGHSTGVVDSKVSYLEGLSSGRVRYRTLETTVDRSVEYSDTVVLHGTMNATIEIEEHARQIDVIYMSVWRLRADGWRMVAFQSARPPA